MRHCEARDVSHTSLWQSTRPVRQHTLLYYTLLRLPRHCVPRNDSCKERDCRIAVLQVTPLLAMTCKIKRIDNA